MGLQVREVDLGSAVVDGDSKQRAAALEAIEKAGLSTAHCGLIRRVFRESFSKA